jgi:hypothetical protein
MEKQKRPQRSATEATVREMVPYCGYPLAEGHVAKQAEGLGLLLAIVTEWESYELGYWFRDGKFGNVPVESQYHAKWRSSRQQARDNGGEAA